MQRLGITHVYDLRSNNEIERAQAADRGGVVEWEGCERVFVPVFTDKDVSLIFIPICCFLLWKLGT
jgi:hypothetical protein